MKSFKEFLTEQEDNEETKIHYPEGVYIAVRPSEEVGEAIKEYQTKYLKGQKVNEDLNCTLIYSQKPHVDEIKPAEYKATAMAQGFDLFGSDKNTLVIKLHSPDLIERNLNLVEEHNFISDYDTYEAHITLCYEIKDLDINSLPEIDFALTLEGEYVEPLDTSWSNSDNEDEDSESGTFVGKEMTKTKNKKDEDKSEEKEDE